MSFFPSFFLTFVVVLLLLAFPATQLLPSSFSSALQWSSSSNNRVNHRHVRHHDYFDRIPSLLHMKPHQSLPTSPPHSRGVLISEQQAASSLSSRREFLQDAFAKTTTATATTALVVLSSPLMLSPPDAAHAASGNDDALLPVSSSSSSSGGTKKILSDDELKAIILSDIIDRQFLVTGHLTLSAYEPTARWQDEIDSYEIKQWVTGTEKLFVGEQSSVRLIGDVVVTPLQAEFRFDEDLMFRLPLGLRPVVHLTGRVVLNRNPVTGLVSFGREIWDQDVSTVLKSAKF
jgi:hypothetical protein